MLVYGICKPVHNISNGDKTCIDITLGTEFYKYWLYNPRIETIVLRVGQIYLII